VSKVHALRERRAVPGKKWREGEGRGERRQERGERRRRRRKENRKGKE